MSDMMIERIVPWTVNGVPQQPFLCTPDALPDLAFGHLLAQGRVTAASDILSISGGEQGLQVTVSSDALRNTPDILVRLNSAQVQKQPFTVSMATLRSMTERLLGSETFYGTHRLMLSNGTEEVFREDVGRHNAADKVIAYGVQHGWLLNRCIVGSTGRISLEMLVKAATMGIPVFFSRKYPSDLSAQWAQRLGIALIAKTHTEHPQVLGAAWRITQ